nr:MAG TPA: hypothetical protein [Caudoviricetes sp.]
MGSFIRIIHTINCSYHMPSYGERHSQYITYGLPLARIVSGLLRMRYKFNVWPFDHSGRRSWCYW